MQSYFDVSNFISKLIFYPNFLLEIFDSILSWDFVVFRGEISRNFLDQNFIFRIFINWLIWRVQFGRIRASGGDRWDTMRDTWKHSGIQKISKIENLWFFRSRYESKPFKTVFLERQNSKSIPTLSKYTFEKKFRSKSSKFKKFHFSSRNFQNFRFWKFVSFTFYLSEYRWTHP